MNDFRFIKYEETPKEKHLGIMTILVRGIMLRYKIVRTKDGSAIFPAPSSYKMSGDAEEERYIHAFSLDSQSEQEMLFDFIRERIELYYPKSGQKLNTIDDLNKNESKLNSNSKSSKKASNQVLDDEMPF